MFDVQPIQRRRVQPASSQVISLKVLVVGDSGVGKTALVRAFTEQGPFLSNYEPTVGSDFAVRQLTHAGREYRVNIWDVSGDPKFLEVRNEFYKEVQGVLLVYDITNRRSFQDLERWMDECAKYSQGADIQLVVVATKVESAPRAVPEQSARDWAKGRSLPYFEVSSVQGKNVEMPFKELASRTS